MGGFLLLLCYLLKLGKVHNEAMRVTLGTTRTHPLKPCGSCLHGLLPMQTRQIVELVDAYFSTVGNLHNPLLKAVKDTEDSRLGRGKS